MVLRAFLAVTIASQRWMTAHLATVALRNRGLTPLGHFIGNAGDDGEEETRTWAYSDPSTKYGGPPRRRTGCSAILSFSSTATMGTTITVDAVSIICNHRYIISI
jgi:hypothetical protein